MEKKEIQDKLTMLGNALKQLKHSLDCHAIAPENFQDPLRSGAIHSFEFSLELYWKVLKKILSYNSIETASPREAIQKAYQSKLINDEQVWIAMLKDRNLTSHTYEETTAEAIFEHIQTYYPVMNTTYQSLLQYVEQLN